jgi:hypothetical protein
VPALIFLWRVRKGICGCQRGGLFVIVRKASNRSVTVCKSKWQSGASSCSSGGSVKVFTDARGGVFFDHMAVRCQLYSPGGSVSCSQMPKGGLLIIWQLGASSCSSGGS